MHIGVDSANTVSQAAFDSVSAQLGRTPEFWGRYVGGRYSASAAEKAVLTANGCRMLVIYNGTGQHVATVNGSVDDGRADATTARNAATALGVPAGTAVYADIEAGWAVSTEWLTGWISELASPSAGGAAYAPGIYCAPLAGLIAVAFCGLPDALKSGCSIFSAQRSHDGSESDTYCSIANLPAAFHPEPIPCGANTYPANIWQFTIHCHDDAYDLDLSDDTAFGLMWN